MLTASLIPAKRLDRLRLKGYAYSIPDTSQKAGQTPSERLCLQHPYIPAKRLDRLRLKGYNNRVDFNIKK